MNMGAAGLLLRTVARAVGPATGANPVVAASGASTAVCSACGAARHSIQSTCSHVALSQSGNSGGSHQLIENEDWELADPSSLSHIPNGSSSSSSSLEDGDNPLIFASGACSWPNVFGMPPSFTEAQEATLELEAALSSDHARHSSNASYDSQCFSPTNSIVDGNHFERHHNTGTVDWIEPHAMTEHCMMQTARNPVHEAINLLRNDPHVKGAVISIVSDPDVWHAMMKNEKVQELKRLLQGTGIEQSVSVEEVNNDNPDWISGVANLLHSIIGNTKQVALKVQEEICRIVRIIFGATNKGWESLKHSSSKEDPAERTIRSSMALAVLVFAIVITKRLYA